MHYLVTIFCKSVVICWTMPFSLDKATNLCGREFWIVPQVLLCVLSEQYCAYCTVHCSQTNAVSGCHEHSVEAMAKPMQISGSIDLAWPTGMSWL